MPGRSVSSGNSTSATPFWGLAWAAVRFGSLMSSGGRSSAGNGLIHLLLPHPRAFGRGALCGSSNSRAARIPVDVDVAADTCGGAAWIPDLIREFHRADVDRVGLENDGTRSGSRHHMSDSEPDVGGCGVRSAKATARCRMECDDPGILNVQERHEGIIPRGGMVAGQSDRKS